MRVSPLTVKTNNGVPSRRSYFKEKQNPLYRYGLKPASTIPIAGASITTTALDGCFSATHQA